MRLKKVEETVADVVAEAPKLIGRLDVDLGRADLNAIVAKVNELVDKANE